MWCLRGMCLDGFQLVLIWLLVHLVFALVLDVPIELWITCLPKPKARPCFYLVNHDPKLNSPLSLHDRTHAKKCLDNFFVGHKVYSGLKQESRVMFPSKIISLFDWHKLMSPFQFACFWRSPCCFINLTQKRPLRVFSWIWCLWFPHIYRRHTNLIWWLFSLRI
jgi:hypothetical protein